PAHGLRAPALPHHEAVAGQKWDVDGKVHSNDRSATGLDLARTRAEEPQLGRVFSRPHVGVVRARAGHGVIEAGEDVEAGVEDPGRLPLTTAYEGVAPADLVVVDAGEVGRHPAPGLGSLPRLLVRLQGADANVTLTGGKAEP